MTGGNHVVTTMPRPPFSIHPVDVTLRVRRSDGVVVDLYGHPTGEVINHPSWNESFPPVLVNGEPYVPEPEPEQPDCYCRRCYLHNDPGGCVADVQFGRRS